MHWHYQTVYGLIEKFSVKTLEESSLKINIPPSLEAPRYQVTYSE